MIRVCFVCLGNICRSPTAEGVLRKLLEEKGWADRVVVESAGTAAYHVGHPADARSRAHARRRGYELDSIARQFQADDFTRFDYVLAMDKQNLLDLRDLRARAGGTGVEPRLFREFDPQGGPSASVPDPYHGGDAGFEEVLDQCERGARGLLVEIFKTRS